MPDASSLLHALSLYTAAAGNESASAALIRDFLVRSSGALFRENPEGHITASAVITRQAGTEFLLLWHRKLGRWLQPGGHVEPSDESVFAAALREAREETGMDDFAFPIAGGILDVDVHPIPAHGSDPPHFHYDFRHLFSPSTRAQAERAGVRGESVPHETRWFTLDEAVAAGVDSSLERALRKASSLLGRSTGIRQSSIVNS